MAILLTSRSDSYAQFIAVLVVFVLVLAATAFTTRWIANYQKQQAINCNIEVLETTRIANNKYVQIIRVGTTYMAIAVCKDTVTLLGEIPAEQLQMNSPEYAGLNFKEMFNKVMKNK